MVQKTSRRIAWLLLLTLCASLLSLPALAAEDAVAATPPPTPAEEVVETPLVNVIEEEPAPAPEAETPAPDTPDTPDTPDAPAEAAPLPEPAVEITPAPGPDVETTPAPEPAEEPADPAVESEEPAADLTASDEPSAELDGASGTYTISYYNGGTLLAKEVVSAGAVPSQAPVQVNGAPVKAWTNAEGTRVDLATAVVKADVSYYAWFLPRLNTARHIRYINGVGNAKFGPTASLTRAQAAQILYQLLESKEMGPFTCVFSDVKDTAWYAAPVKTLASLGVINGYKDGTFGPNKTITRAEFVTMLVNLTGVTGEGGTFTDVSAKHWARRNIAAAAAQGWISGYLEKNGTYTFRPSRTITRAEAVVVMNRVLGRSGKNVTEAPGLLHFIDVKTSDWWYSDVLEASVAHEHTGVGTGETWTSFTVESCGLEPGLHKVGAAYVYVDGNRQPMHVDAGITNLGGQYVYAPSAGYSFTADLSSKDGYITFANGAADQALRNGFNRIGNTLFYWIASEKAPQALTAGLNPIAGKTYWADRAGYVIRNSFVDAAGKTVSGKGPVVLGGKTYLTDGACAIITSGMAYASDNSILANIDLRDKTYEFDGYMYYVQSDYSLLTSGYFGYLYFDANGRYTSGDAELDSIVYNIVGGTINNNTSRVYKLLQAYYYLRGGWGTNFVDNGFTYRNKGETFYIQRYNFNDEGIYGNFRSCAKRFYNNHYGRCYEWASAYLYLARRLGFQDYLVVGNIGDLPGVKGNPHCWNMILWDGTWHLSDVETEWGWLKGYYGGNTIMYRNLFDQALPSEHVSYFANSDARIYYFFP